MPDPIHEIADSLEPQLREQFLLAVDRISALVPQEVLLEAIQRGDRLFITEMVRRAAFQSLDVSQAAITPIFEQLLTRAASVTASSMGFNFVIRQPRVASWIAANVGQLVTGITAQTVQAINRVVLAGFTEGIPPARQARTIRGLIGLLPEHAMAADRMERAGANEAAVAAYRRRMLAWRASMIARTESMRGANAGQYELWAQMMADGLIDFDTSWFVWDVVEDDRLCPYCAPMDGQRRRFGYWFVSQERGFPEEVRSGGADPFRDKIGRPGLVPLRRPSGVPFPPLHPHCRCRLKLEIET